MGLSPTIIEDRMKAIRREVPDGVTIVAVSKFQPIENLKSAYNAGQRAFGESRVQELLEKIPLMPSDVKWHFIGHLQTNKVKSLIGKTFLIESVDSLKLLELIDKESREKNVVTDLLLQVHVASEETKFGFSKEEILAFFLSGKYRYLKSVHICGLMAMATNTENTDKIREDFRNAAEIYHEIQRICEDNKEFKILSMGMSGDWSIAIEEGSNEVRIGSSIFGARY